MSERVVADLMNPNVVCAHPEMTVREAAQLLAKRGVSGAPVVDEKGRPIGVVTQNDLVRHESQRATAGESGRFYTDVIEYQDLASLPVDLSQTPVEDVMTRSVITISKTESVATAARLMRERRVHRLLVTEQFVLVGIITSLDLLKVVAEG